MGSALQLVVSSKDPLGSGRLIGLLSGGVIGPNRRTEGPHASRRDCRGRLRMLVIENAPRRAFSREPDRRCSKVPGKPGGGQRGRSAITGKFVKQTTVKRHPKTTVNESTKKK
jgi:hypothetical protein